MDSSRPPFAYVDPKQLLYETGGGVDDSHYNNEAAPAADAAIDLEENATILDQPLQAGRQTVLEERTPPKRDVEHHASIAMPLPTTRSSLRAEAPVFIPGSLQPPHLTLDTRVQPEPAIRQAHRVTPSKPRITVSRSPDGRADCNGPLHRCRRQNSKTRDKQSSPDRRSASVSRQRQQKRPVKSAPPAATTTTAHLSPPIAATPAHWVMGTSHVGDFLQSYAPRMAPPPMVQWPGYAFSAPMTSTTPSLKSDGYRCNYEGCDEVDKVWDTRSDLNHHQRKHLSKDQRPHACVVCKKPFHFPKDVRRHMRVHDGTRTSCPLCHKPISRQDNLSRHMASQHNDMQAALSPSQVIASSPTASSVTSFAQSPYSESGPSTPRTLSPLAAKAAASAFQTAIQHHDSMNNIDPFLDTASSAPFLAPPMLKSLSNLT